MNPVRRVGEMIGNWDISRLTWLGPSLSKLRSHFTWSQWFRKPIAEGTTVNRDLARSLYRNDSSEHLYGGGFVKPIVDLRVEYMGLPSVSTEEGDNDAFLNECIRDYWGQELQEMFRDAIRDGDVVVRFYQQRIDNPLYTARDRRHGRLELIPPERVDITFDPVDKDTIIRVVIEHEIEIDQRTDQEILAGKTQQPTKHTVLEIITPDRYSFYDRTAGEELETWGTPNVLNFVPIWPAYNEWAADLDGGQSELEPVLPFIEAFHEALSDAMAAHNYHSIPKVKLKLRAVEAFIENNWPGTLDPTTGKPKEGAKINWQNDAMIFLNLDEDADFISMKSSLGDSVSLLRFLLDCIAMSAQTPKWALLADENSSNDNATIDAFEKMINRKRVSFQRPIVMLLKMALVAIGKTPETPKLTWPEMRLETLAAKGQAIQQIILGLDVASQHEWIADSTAIKILQAIFTEVNSVEVEKQLAKSNVVPEIPAPAPASSTDAGGAASKNGKPTKKASQKALATTSASNS